MIPTRWLIISFWVFVGGMLAWQAYNYEINSEKESAARPAPQHFFFDPAMDQKPAAADPNLHEADIRQTKYSITQDPVTKFLNCQIVLTNKGNAKAVGVQVFLRPYHGGIIDGARNGDGGPSRPLSDLDPVALMGQSLEAPDLAPGESCTLSATFMSRPGVSPASNPKPQITFLTEKAKP